MADQVAKVPKPQLRGLLQNSIKRSLIVAITASIVAVVAQKVLYNDRRKNIYAEFYKNYDINKEFNRIRNKGLFDSCEPDK